MKRATTLLMLSAFVLAGLTVFFMFILGGYSMIAGAGASDPKKTGQGRQAVTYAVIGFVVIFAAYWIVRIIEIITKSNLIT